MNHKSHTKNPIFRQRLLSLALPFFTFACALPETHDAPTPTTVETSVETTRPLSNSNAGPEQSSTSYRLATPQEASIILSKEDEYTAVLQPTELGIKNRNSTKTTLADLQESYRNGVLPWTQEESEILNSIIAETSNTVRPYAMHLPSSVLIAKVSKNVEGGIAHTRGNLILFSENDMAAYANTIDSNPEKAKSDLTALFFHELHHVLSRYNSEKHDAYYALIGYKPCVFDAPESLRANRLTNPDAPTYKHYAPVTLETGNGVIPYLSVTGPYQDGSDTTLGNYFGFGLLAVNAKDGTCTIAGDEPSLLSPAIVPDFFKLIGQNTGYIIHPEETLADNFSYLLLGREGLPNPEIPEKIRTFWLGE